ncbi:hypothetical protein HYQ46_000573 [Verticillium longisporum]|nr:hypothetical protein HYQ46_000573 [Verticillium longisporum]
MVLLLLLKPPDHSLVCQPHFKDFSLEGLAIQLFNDAAGHLGCFERRKDVAPQASVAVARKLNVLELVLVRRDYLQGRFNELPQLVLRRARAEMFDDDFALFRD